MTSSHDTLAALATVSTEAEAQLMVNMLNDRGITAVATGGFTSQLLPGAQGVVRVLVKQESLPVAQSVLAEHEKERCSWELADENSEPSGYEPRLTKFLIRCLLIIGLIYIVGALVALGMGENGIGGLAALAVAVLLLAAILTRRWWSLKV